MHNQEEGRWRREAIRWERTGDRRCPVSSFLFRSFVDNGRDRRASEFDARDSCTVLVIVELVATMGIP